mmetsp:Transcript_64058/g.187427  ORF Transcript_64058/g.187427 Transcript_64058/m.187427 type:complete len:243 (-) Transcript_64058:485-1213(-)
MAIHHGELLRSALGDVAGTASEAGERRAVAIVPELAGEDATRLPLVQRRIHQKDGRLDEPVGDLGEIALPHLGKLMGRAFFVERGPICKVKELLHLRGVERVAHGCLLIYEEAADGHRAKLLKAGSLLLDPLVDVVCVQRRAQATSRAAGKEQALGLVEPEVLQQRVHHGVKDPLPPEVHLANLVLPVRGQHGDGLVQVPGVGGAIAVADEDLVEVAEGTDRAVQAVEALANIVRADLGIAL